MDQNVTKIVLTILKFCHHIWIHLDKCIQISTNMPSIGLVIPEISIEILESFEKTTFFMALNQWLLARS